MRGTDGRDGGDVVSGGADEEHPSPDGPVRFLVVGDDSEYQEALRSLLGRLQLNASLEAVFLCRIADARQVVDRARVDVVVSESVLPDGTSADLFKVVKERMPSAQRIVLAEHRSEEVLIGYEVSGVQDLWAKDDDSREVRKRMERILAVRALATVRGRSRSPLQDPRS